LKVTKRLFINRFETTKIQMEKSKKSSTDLFSSKPENKLEKDLVVEEPKVVVHELTPAPVGKRSRFSQLIGR